MWDVTAELMKYPLDKNSIKFTFNVTSVARVGTHKSRVLVRNPTLHLCATLVWMSRKIRILAVGRSHDRQIAPLIHEYESRLSIRMRVEWQFIPHESGTKNARGVQVSSESNSIRSSLKKAEYVIVLDDTGTQLTSDIFSEKLHDLASDSQDICFVIGGAYGVDDALLAQADFVWSLGKLTLPHQLVRAVLIEQLYRAVSIWDGRSYHHGD